MAYEIAKMLLASAGTAVERTEAVRGAISQRMLISKIEEYLDWLDTAHPLPPEGKREVVAAKMRTSQAARQSRLSKT
jgi:hypothetical protein